MKNNGVRLVKSETREISNLLNSFKINFDNLKIKEEDYFDIIDIRPNPGVSFSKIEKILPDLGLYLKSHSIPRGYPVYREGIYRIEIQKRELASRKFSELYRKPPEAFIPITLGVEANGQPFIIDLHRLPNLLIGGVPGSGKSVLLHSIILSLIANKSLLYLADPKMVEFNSYQDNRQIKMLASSLEEMYDLINEVIAVMNDRFETMKWSGVRNIQEYNIKVRPQKNLAPLVIVIDEWADLILQDSKIQKPLCLIAQKGRAAGISIVLATQRPSSNVISGLIKANFSGRIALRVASGVDSRIILDESGGEKIQNVGEGLYLDQSLSEPKVFRATYIESPQAELEGMDELKSTLPFWKRIWL